MKFEDLIETISKEELYDLYVTQNLTRAEVAERLDIKCYAVDKLCKHYEIIKPQNLSTLRRVESNAKRIDETVAKIKATKLERYGSASYNNIDKRHETCLERYGVEAYTNRDKAKQTTLENYGVEYTAQIPESRKKTAQTKLERYGDSNYNNLEKTRKTKLARYGNANYVNSAKGKATKRLKYGDENYNNLKKREQTCLDRYGVSNYRKSTIFKQKSKFTKLQRYGNANYNNIEQIRETCLEKYGYEYACMRPEARKGSSNNSSPNKYFEDIFTANNIEYEREFALNNRSYDFKIGNNLVEINPTPTHNSTWSPFGEHKGIDKDYHHNKSQLAVDNNYRCIHIWDWDDIDKILLLLQPKERIYGRKCSVKEVTTKDAKEFINTYHLQGYAKSDLNLGLYFESQLVSIMTFGKPRYNKKYQYELIRYCSSCNIVGGSEKLFKYFIDRYNPQSIISYCDLSKFTGAVYSKLGFTYKYTSIGKHWYNMKNHKHITDNLLRQRGYDQLFNTNYGKGSSNEELMLVTGFVEIYDAGQATYTWTIEQSF